ncbi:Helix-turn-helix domain-containing protein [Lachnospiraceae bacterium C7]|nr:Helix-turn-helix domain-containing protein [Lachnospiraceae bacterium C7]
MVMPSYKKYESLIVANDITTAQVSMKTGVPASSLSDWKCGKTFPKIDKIWTLAKFFNVKVEDLLEEI